MTNSVVTSLIVFLTSCADSDIEPYANDRNAEVAANACGIEEWSWVRLHVFDGPQFDEDHFGYELKSLASEEIAVRRGRAWDRTIRIAATDACLEASFKRQGVHAYIWSPALRLEIVGGSNVAGEMAN